MVGINSISASLMLTTYLVLDEADRLLDLGFLPALKAIVSHFSPVQTAPGSRPSRQTLLFSATQSKDLAALAKLSLHEPLYISCNKPGEEGVMPANLEQYYAVVPLERKLDALWGFVKSHLKMKGIVFVTSGKQARQVLVMIKYSSLIEICRFDSSLKLSNVSTPVSHSCTSTASKSNLLVWTFSNDSPPPNQLFSSVPTLQLVVSTSLP